METNENHVVPVERAINAVRTDRNSSWLELTDEVARKMWASAELTEKFADVVNGEFGEDFWLGRK